MRDVGSNASRAIIGNCEILYTDNYQGENDVSINISVMSSDSFDEMNECMVQACRINTFQETMLGYKNHTF